MASPLTAKEIQEIGESDARLKARKYTGPALYIVHYRNGERRVLEIVEPTDGRKVEIVN